MNEKTKSNLFALGFVAALLWAISVSIAAGVFAYGRNTARDELAAIKETPVDVWLQSNLDSISKRNTELEKLNRELADELGAASDAGAELERIINSAAELAESGRQSLWDAGQSVGGIAGTVDELRDNYQQLANIVIASERNYNAIIGELGKGAGLVGANGETTFGEQ